MNTTTPQFDPTQDELLVALYRTHLLTWGNFWRWTQIRKLFDNAEDEITGGTDCHASTVILQADGMLGGEFEAIPGGVVFAEKFGENHPAGFQVELFRFNRVQTVQEKQTQWNFLVSQLGRPYDWTGDVRFVPGLRWVPDQKGALFCSDYCFAGCDAGNEKLLNVDNPKLVSPPMIRESMEIHSIGAVVTGGDGVIRPITYVTRKPPRFPPNILRVA